MSVLIFIEQADGQIKKASFEAAAYGAKLAEMLGSTAEGVVIGTVNNNLAELGKYGLKKIHTISDCHFFDSQVFTKIIAEVVENTHADVVVFSNSNTAKAIAPRLSVKLKAGFVPGAVALPDLSAGFSVRKSVFSGKAFAHVQINTPRKIIALNPNSYQISTVENLAEVVPFNAVIDVPKTEVINITKTTGDVPLTEAAIVVSGGRGLKGPENWGLVTELASLLGAATACSRPVADVHWRPHHEHVGQTGIAIAPNLYIALGISGAIQHLAGVNRSKTIVVINKDPEAPFFKAADYGIVGDVFEVMPKIIDAVKKLKGVA